MLSMAHKTSHLLVFILVGILATTSTTLAEPPSGGKNNNHNQQQKHAGKDVKGSGHSEIHPGDDTTRHTYFTDRNRDVVRNYYAEQYRSGKCPPGLAKKNNGCMPPGQAKKWAIGRPLPRDVIFYDLPHSVSVQLGIPPSGHRFVRVASDILLIAVGTGMVVDAIDDLGNL